MKYIVYILFCDQKTFYVGITRDIDKRFEEHKSKASFFTKKFSDIQVVYQEMYKTINDAEKRERQLKGWSFAKKKALVDGQIKLLKQLSKAVSLAKPLWG